MVDLVKSAKKIQDFEHGDLTKRIANLEAEFEGTKQNKIQSLCSINKIDDMLINSAIALKTVMGQIDVVIHVVGIALLLPKILQREEVIESISLGAGNTGKKFDLETNLRIAEFKFIHWRGGAESIRQNSLFKDFFYLAEENSDKKRYLYVLGTEYPLKFLNSNRTISSILSRNVRLSNIFKNRYHGQFSKVSDYYHYRKHLIAIIDINKVMPSLARSLQ
jgi:hypothetical protein